MQEVKDFDDLWVLVKAKLEALGWQRVAIGHQNVAQRNPMVSVFAFRKYSSANREGFGEERNALTSQAESELFELLAEKRFRGEEISVSCGNQDVGKREIRLSCRYYRGQRTRRKQAA